MSSKSQEQSPEPYQPSPRSSDDGQSLHSVSKDSLRAAGSSDSNFSSPSYSERSTGGSDTGDKVYQNQPDAMDQNEGPTPTKTERQPEKYVEDMTEVSTVAEKELGLKPDENPIIPGKARSGGSSQQSS